MFLFVPALVGCDASRSGCSVEDLEVIVESKEAAVYASVKSNTEIEQYNWSFSDGFEEATTDPWVDHIFTESGNHSVELKVDLENGNDCSLETSFVIDEITTVVDSCDIDITSWKIQDNQLSVEVSAVGTKPYTVYNWDFGDGTEWIGNASAAEHLYEKPGTYLVEIGYSTFEGCSDKTQKYITIDSLEVECEIEFLTDPAVNGKTVSLAIISSNVSNNAKYYWDMGDAKPALTTSSSQYIYSYSLPGTYVVTVEVVDGDCSSETSYSVQIQ